jgi:hypothetical protein
MRDFALRDENGSGIGVFTGKSPRQAALKVPTGATRTSDSESEARQAVHVFTGERVQVDKIWEPIVKNVGVETPDEV